MMRKPFVVLLTGGIACGKTFVSDYWKTLGVNIIDTDIISHQLTAEENPQSKIVLNEIKMLIGESVFLRGKLDRARLREYIFHDIEAKIALENILHPKIFQEVMRQVTLIKSLYHVIVLPIIHPASHYLSIANKTLVVEVFEEDQIERLISRDQIEASLARKIIHSQISRLERRQLGNDIIINTRRENVKRVLRNLHQKYVALSRLSVG